MASRTVSRRTLAALGAATAAVLLAVGAVPASASTNVSAAAADEQANGGGFRTVGAGFSAESAAERALAVHLNTPANNLCTGAWTHPVSTVQFQRAAGGTLAWSFKLSNTAKAALGPVVTTTMPFSYVNGRAINPPYQPHTEPNWYNFHGSLNGFQFIGGGGGTIQTGNKVTFYWFLKGSKPNTAADRYITCQVPRPGSA